MIGYEYILYEFKDPTAATDVSLLTAGISGAVVLSVYSSDLNPSGFLIPRTVDATAVLFAESIDTSFRNILARKFSYENSYHNWECPRSRPQVQPYPILPKEDRKSPLLKQVSRIIRKVHARIGRTKIRVANKLGIGCLVPKLTHPFEPMFRYLRCKLGFKDDEYMEAAQCNAVRCEESISEEKLITNSRPTTLRMMNLDVQTKSDCFKDVREVKYGARVLAKLIRDASCDDPEYQQICQDLLNENRIIEEDGCRTKE